MMTPAILLLECTKENAQIGPHGTPTVTAGETMKCSRCF